MIPKGAQIRKVETLLSKEYGFPYSFQWIGDDGKVLVKIDGIDEPNQRSNKYSELQTLTLKPNQRLVGVKSASFGKK